MHKKQRTRNQYKLDRKGNLTEMAEERPDPKAVTRFRTPAYQLPPVKKRVDAITYIQSLGIDTKGEMPDGQDSPK